MSSNFVPTGDRAALKTGTMIRVTVQDQDILLADVEGTVYAVDDMCSHEDASL